MNTKLYVDNLAAISTYNDLMDLFSAHGNVVQRSISQLIARMACRAVLALCHHGYA
jgi:hypothetical protein